MGFLQDLTGSSAAKASNAAAADTYGKKKNAIDDLMAYGDTLPGQYSDISKRFDPFISAGTDALGLLRSGLGLPGGTGDFTAAYRATPGYQAGLDTGSRTVAQRFNAGNMGQSGAAMKGLQRFGSDYEDQRSGDFLTRLMGLAGQGESATGAAAGIDTAGLGARTGVRTSAFGGQMDNAGTIGQGMVAGAQAKQQGTQGLLNAGVNLAGMAMGMPPTNLARPTAANQSNPSTWWPAPRA